MTVENNRSSRKLMERLGMRRREDLDFFDCRFFRNSIRTSSTGSPPPNGLHASPSRPAETATHRRFGTGPGRALRLGGGRSDRCKVGGRQAALRLIAVAAARRYRSARGQWAPGPRPRQTGPAAQNPAFALRHAGERRKPFRFCGGVTESAVAGVCLRDQLGQALGQGWVNRASLDASDHRNARIDIRRHAEQAKWLRWAALNSRAPRARWSKSRIGWGSSSGRCKRGGSVAQRRAASRF